MASPTRARGPRSTAPASPSAISAAPATVRPIPTQALRGGGSPSSGPAASPTNSGEQAASTVEDATVVSASEAFQSAKCNARNPPETASQPASLQVGRVPRWRRANGASTSAPPKQRQKASASAGTCATRTRMGEVEIAAAPTTRPSAIRGAESVGGATPPAATAWPRGLIGSRRVILKQFPSPPDEAERFVVFAHAPPPLVPGPIVPTRASGQQGAGPATSEACNTHGRAGDPHQKEQAGRWNRARTASRRSST